MFSDWPNRLRGVRGVLVDSNILIDLAATDGSWSTWSGDALRVCGNHTTLVLNPIIYAEVSASYNNPLEVDAALPEEVFQRDPLPWRAAFLAGRCFVAYRRGGGLRRSPLPDFYIGAHAVVEGFGLLTRDAARYRNYFPRLLLFAPSEPAS